MPHARCSICTHAQFDAIALMLKAGESVRVVARRFGLSHAAVNRHQHEDDRTKNSTNIGQTAKIDEEIKKLIRAQNRAKRKRDSAGALAIARELRNWFVLRQKAEVVEASTTAALTSGGEIPLRDAVAISKSVIESQFADPEIQAWLTGMVERIPERVTGKLPDTQE
jgi:transposase-like protein